MFLQHRSLLKVFLLTVITFGIYYIFWFYNTKEEINSLGAEIPSFVWFWIPFVNFYFFYKYSEAFAKFIKKDGNAILYFIILVCLPLIGELYIQDSLNIFIKNNLQNKDNDFNV